jgi:hypothetical protein
MARELGWSDGRCELEVDAYLANAVREYAVTPAD